MITSADEFQRLRTSDDLVEQSRAAKESASPEVWVDLVANYPEMRFWVAQNKTVPLEILELLMDDEDARVRSMVARRRKLSPDMLEKLSFDPDDSVRLIVAHHKSVPDRVVRRLASSDPWEEVRQVAMSRLSRFPIM